MKSLADFLSELKRRRVYRVAVVYAGVAFIIFEVADFAFPALDVPDWVSGVVVVLLALGLLIAVGMAWAFDLTEEGLVRTKAKGEASTSKAPHPLVGNKTLAVIAVLAIAFGIWALVREPSMGDATIRSIAVLPLDNLSGNSEDEGIVDGLHDDLISEMNKISALTVRGRQSTLQYRNSEKTIPVIASELDVDALIEGSALLIGDRIRIIIQLIDNQDSQLWTNTYERDFEDVFALYNDVISAIVQELKAALTPEEEANLASAPQVNREAYDLYLQGRYYRENRGEAPIPPVELLEQSVALDSTFAPAWAILSIIYFGTEQSKIAVDKALELDPDLSVAYVALGLWQSYNMDWDGAEDSYQKALELDPHDNWSYYEYGHFLGRFGRYDEAFELVQRFREIDPFNPQVYRVAAETYGRIRNYEKYLEYRKLQARYSGGDSDFPGIEFNVLMQQGNYAEAAVLAEQTWGNSDLRFLEAAWRAGNQERVSAIRDSLQRTGELEDREQENPVWVARFHIILGERETALRLLEVAQESDPYNATRYYSVLGEREKALDLLEQYYENFPEVLPIPNSEGYRMIYIVHDKDFDPLRAEPRFKALLRQLHLMEAFDENGQLLRPLPEGF